MTQRYHYIAVEGNIGAGKTTLARLLARRQGRRLILEEFDDNPFLPPFYRDPERYAFPVELFFMAERHKQLQSELAQDELFASGIVSDYLFVKTLLFARNSLSEDEFRLFHRLFTVMEVNFPPPDLIVYLHRPVPALRANISKRGRSFEADIKDKYLMSVQEAYFSYFRLQKEVPIIVLDLKDRDFTRDDDLLHRIFGVFTQKFAPGVQRLVL